MAGTTLAPSDRDRKILQSFARRIDAWDAGAANNCGVLYFTRGMVDEAAAMFTRALDLDPRMTVAQRNLEIAYFTSGYYDRRVQELSARLAVAPGDREARWEYARTCLLLGDVTRALDAFGALLRTDPDDVRVIRQVATAEMRAGDLEAAERWLVHALDLAPDNPAVLFQRGEIAYHRGLNEVARRALERSVSLAPDDADAWYLLGFVLGDLGQHEEAMAARQRALRLNPSLGRARANLSLERFDPRSWEQANAAKTARGVTAPVAETPMPHFHLALAFRQKGYLAEALRAYGQALASGEDREVVQAAMAEVHLMRGEMQEALVLYDALLEAAPGRARFWNERGIALHHMGRNDEALASYVRAVEADAHALAPRNNLGVAACHAGDRERAAASFIRVLEGDPGHEAARLNLALLHAVEGRHAEALATYRELIERDKDHAAAWNGAGTVLTTLERYAPARDAFSRAIEANPGLAAAHYNLGFVLSQLGEHEAALRETQRALEIDSFYTPPRFELVVDFAHDAAHFQVALDANGGEAIPHFAFQPAELDTLFDELQPARATVEARPVLEAARAARERGAIDEAHVLVREALGTPDPSDEALLLQGELFLAQGMAGEAVERFRQVRRANPASVPAVVGEVRGLVALHHEEDAAGLVDWLEGREGLDATALTAMAAVHAAVGREDDARAAMARARALAPLAPDVLVAAATLARRLHDPGAAIKAYRAAIATGAADPEAYVDLAVLQRECGDLEGASDTLETACRRDPDHAPAVLARAEVARLRGQAVASIPDLAGFLITHPWQLDVLGSLAESLLAAGRDTDARFAVDRVLRFDPGHGTALFVDGALRAAAYDFDGALAAWDRLEASEPASDAARRAQAERVRLLDRRQHLVGSIAGAGGD